MSEQPCLIILASSHSYRQDAFQAAAEQLGIPVVQGLDVPPPLLPSGGANLAIDYRDLPLSVERVLDFAADRPVGYVLGLDDSGALLAARANEALGIPHNSPEATIAARDKWVMRQRFSRAGVPSPVVRKYLITDDPEDIAADLEASGAFPVVIKPTTMSGSRGVMRADDPFEFVSRWERLRPMLEEARCDDVLVEGFIPGFEVALEGLLDDGRLHVLALFDKPDPLDGPFFEETIYTTPSRLPAETQQAIREATQAAAASLGLQRGPIHAELRVNESGPVLLEVAARSIGGLCSQTLSFGPDISLEALILRQAFGQDVSDTERQDGAEGVMMIPIPEPGILRTVTGVTEALAVPLIDKIEITAPLHYPVVPLPEGESYLGFIFASGETPAAVEAALRVAHELLHFQIEPELHLTSR
ncbi:MAG: ATP-grasp domain-containing protein [Ardenticatenales bacterium]|nr:ATP-grasp domain-containing protein [Ardenticatenales bacterium]